MITINIVSSVKDIDDASYILSNYAEVRNYDAALGDYKTEIEQIKNKYAKPQACLLIARLNNEAAGIVAFRPFKEYICEMKRLYVLDKFKGKGIGKALVRRIIEEARISGYKTMYLDTHPWMEAAQNIYNKFGFEEIDAYHYNPTIGIRFFKLEL